MNDLASQDDLLLKARSGRGIGGYLGPNDLESHSGILKKLVFHFIDLSHAAACDKANHAKTTRDQLSRMKAGRVARGRRVVHRYRLHRKNAHRQGLLQQVFDASAEFRRPAACLVKKGCPTRRL